MAYFTNRIVQDQRQERRYETDLEGRLVWDGVSQPVRIRNISIYGAMLGGAFLPPVGARVVLIAEGLEACGSVIWLREEQCGILLEQAVEPLALLRERRVRTDSRLVTLERIGPGRYA